MSEALSPKPVKNGADSLHAGRSHEGGRNDE